MVKKGYTPEQIIGKLREAEILLSQGVRYLYDCERLDKVSNRMLHICQPNGKVAGLKWTLNKSKGG